jgi:hypothetical protein
MTHRDAVDLIDNSWLRNLERPTRWADLGCGSGTFTLALADLLAPGSTIEAIDLHPSIAPQTTKNGVTIHPRTADFTTLNFARPTGLPASPNAAATPKSAASPGSASPDAAAILPPRLWPGTEPLAYHGILMANSLHYVRDQHTFLAWLKTNALLLVEYDVDIPVGRWVPYPLSFAAAIHVLPSAGWNRVQKLGTLRSMYYVGAASPRSSSSDPSTSLGNAHADLYAALALPEE